MELHSVVTGLKTWSFTFLHHNEPNEVSTSQQFDIKSVSDDETETHVSSFVQPDPSGMEEEEEEEDYNGAEAHMEEGYGDGINNGDQAEDEDMEDELHENGSWTC